MFGYGRNNNQKKVTIAIAKDVHHKFVDDPTGEQSPVINLCVFTDAFAEHINSIMEKGYLDVHLGLTKSKNLSPSRETDKVRLPSVVIHRVNSKDESPTVPFSVMVVHNFVSPQFMNKWIKTMNELSFTRGQGGKSKAFIRNCSTTIEPAPILIGTKLVYGGLVPDEMETHLLKMAVFLATEQRKIIENLHGRYKVTWHCNLIHTVLASIQDALYAAHSDANPTCCSDPEPGAVYIRVQDDMYLPKQHEMQVATMVFSNSKEEYSTELVYSEISKKQVMKRIPLSSCCLHWQGPGSQSLGIEHHVKVLPNCVRGGIFRAHSTFRFTLDPKECTVKFNDRLSMGLQITTISDPSSWIKNYDQTRVIDLCTGCDSVGEMKSVTIQSPNVTAVPSKSNFDTGHAIVNLYSESLTDCYDQISRERYIQLLPDDKFAKIRLAGTIAQELSSACSVKTLLDAGYLLTVQPSCNGVGVPCIHQICGQTGYHNESAMPVPGKRYRLSNICAEAGLIHRARTHRIYNSKAGTQRIIVISQSYKNDYKSIVNFLKRLDERERVTEKRPFFDTQFDGTIWIHGSGGSPSFPGDVPPDADINRKDDPMIVIPRSQNLQNPLNRALMEMVMGNQVVTIYVNESMFEAGNKPDDNNLVLQEELCRCLGVFHAHELAAKRDTEQEVVSAHCEDPIQKQIFSRYKLAPYLRVAFKPLLTNTDLDRIWEADGREHEHVGKRLKMLLIPFDCKEHLQMNIPVGGVKDASSLTPGRMILRSDIIEQFIRSGEIQKFIVPRKREINDQRCTDLVGNEGQADEDIDGIMGREHWSVETSCNPTCTIDRGMSTDTYGLVSAMVLCSVAGALRYAKKCFEVVNEKEFARPLTRDSLLPVIFRIHPMPMPNRALDVISIGLRQELVRDGTFGRCQTRSDSRIVYQTGYRADLIGTAFKSTVLRFTGRLNSFLQYSRATGREELLPNIDGIQPFLSFVRSTLPTTGKSKGIARWISDQHAHSIPRETKVYTGFAQFLISVGQQLPRVVDEMLVGQEGKSLNRYMACTKFRDMLLQCCQASEKNKLNFLAHQVLADVEEIFADPFGLVEPHNILMGSGAEQGFKMLKNFNGPQSPRDVKEAMEMITKYMNDVVTSDDLSMMGYSGNDSGKLLVVNKVNGRPFNATDAEHFLCKLWVISKYTLPANSYATQAKATKPHCHPVYWRGKELPIVDSVDSIMNDIITLHEQVGLENEIPDFCLLPNELSICTEEIGVSEE